MNFLDIRTVLFSAIISGFICMAVMVSLWLQNRRRSPELGFWLADFVMQFVAILLIALRGALPDFLSIVIGNALVIGGTLLLYFGLERYLGKTSPRWPNYLYLAAFSLAHTYFAFVQPSLPARNINLALGLLVICAQCAWLLLRRVDSALRSETRPVGLIFTVFSLVSLVRIFVDLVVPREHDLFQSGLYDVLAILIYQMLFIGLTFALFLMVNRRLFAALDGDIAARKLKDEALRASEERYRMLIEQAPDGIFIADAQGRDIEVNPRGCEMLGYTRQELLELSMQQVVATAEQKVTPLRIDEMREGKTVISERRMMRKDGSLLPVEICGRMTPDGRMIGFVRDITERKQAEEAIHSLARFPAENPNPVLRITQEGKLLYANQAAFAQLKDWKLEQGAPLPEILQAAIRAVFETQAARTIEIPCGECTFSIAISPVIENEYVNLYGRDITERKRAEDELRQSQENFARAFISSPTALAITRRSDGKFLSLNEAYTKVMGYAPADILGRTPAEMQIYAHTDERDQLIQQLREQGCVRNYELLVNTQSGEVRSLLVSMEPILYDQEASIISTFIDITERKQAEETLRESEKRFRSLFENMLNGFAYCQMLFDQEHPQDFIYLDVNRAFETLTGLKEVVGKKVSEVIPGILESDRELIALYGRVALTGIPEVTETYVAALKMWFSISVYSPQKEYFVAVFDVITERKQNEETLITERNLLHTLIDILPDYIFVKDVNSRLILDNIAHQRHLGATALKEVVGKTDFDFFPRELAAAFIADEQKIIQSGEAMINREEPSVDLDGNRRWLLTTKAPLRDRRGMITGIVGINHEITARKQTEEKLIASEMRYRRLFEAARDGILILDADSGVVIDVNPFLVEMLGFSQEEIRGKELWELGFFKDIAANKANFLELQQKEFIRYEDLPLETTAGRKFHVEFISNVYQVDHRRVVQCNIRDITERKRAEEALQNASSYNRSLIEASIDPLVTIGYDGKITDVNTATEEATGFDREHLIGSDFSDYFTEPEQARHGYQQVLAQGQVKDYPLTILHANGKTTDVLYNATVYKNANGRIEGVFAAARDITAHKQVEAARQQSEILFRTLFELSPDAVVLLDPHDRNSSSPIVDCNTAACLMNGYQRDELIGQSIDIVNADPYTPVGQSAYLERLRDAGSLKYEVLHRHKSGVVFPVEVSTTLIKVGERELVIGIDRDITERKRAEQQLTHYAEHLEEVVAERTRELREAQEKLLRQERLATLGQLAGSIGHELRNPLGVISNAVYFLKMTQPEASAKVREYLDIIDNETHTSDKIVTDLLDFTRIKSINRQPAAVAELVHQTLERYPAPPTVQVALAIPANLPKIFTDPQHVLQVLGNLVVNAYQAMEAQASSTGTPDDMQLTVFATMQSDMIRIEVRDTGTGIPPENMDKLFEPLFTTKTKGIGLGLAVSKKLAEANGGRIEVTSEAGKGSTFTLVLPIYRSS